MARTRFLADHTGLTWITHARALPQGLFLETTVVDLKKHIVCLHCHSLAGGPPGTTATDVVRVRDGDQTSTLFHLLSPGAEDGTTIC